MEVGEDGWGTQMSMEEEEWMSGKEGVEKGMTAVEERGLGWVH